MRKPKKQEGTRALWARVFVTPRQKKKLGITEEEFYLQCTLMVGAPNADARDYHSGQYSRGTMAYLREMPKGKAFLSLLQQHGEAKSRAG